jgi:NADPH-dependent 2,4-dienoyl-CoA reductase/sulfur reductase-like enzyme
MEDLVVRRADVFREKQGIRLLTGHRVESVDPRGKTVCGTTLEGKAFEQPYDRLLIATGASAVLPDLPGIDLPGVMTLKTLADGRRLKQFLADHPVTNAVILGMGYIALETCEALRARGIGVDMIKPNPRFLPWLAEDLAGAVKAEVEANGVRIHAGHRPERIEAVGGVLQVKARDLTLSGEMVLVAAGVQPCSRLAADAGLALGAGEAVAVDRRLRTSVDTIFGAGDCADAYHVVTGAKTWIPLALRANRAGWAVADNVCGGATRLPGVAGTAVFKVFDFEVARTGLNAAEAREHGFEPAEVTIQARNRAHAHPGASMLQVSAVGDAASGRLLGMQIVGRDGAAHRINGAAVALHAGMTVAEFAQADLAYAPPFGPTWDPMLTAANQLLKRL